MSFASDLKAATELATEYTQLTATIGGMATAADHDPSWGERDEAELNEKYARQAVVGKLIAAAIADMARDHRDDWQKFLVSSTERLDLVTKHVKKNWVVAEYERDQFRRWVANALPAADQPEIFARGLAQLAEHGDVIERVARK